MRRLNLAIIMVLLLSVGFSQPVFAQTPATIEFEKAQINLWPEYDRPDVLIIYRLTLSPKTTLPAQISLRLPQIIGDKPSAVAMKDASGALVNLNYTATPDPGGEWVRIAFTTPLPELQIEYYDSRLVKDVTRRTFEYTWPGDYLIKALEIMVQQPVNSTQMQIFPSLGAGSINPDDGLTYYNASVGRVSAGTTFNVRLTYVKSDSKLSMTTQPVQPSSDGTVFRTVLDNQSLLIAGGLVIGAILLFGIVALLSGYWKPGKKGSAFRKRHAVRETEPREAAQSLDSATYCHQCGKPSRPGDVFCRVCGTKIRVGSS